MYDISVGRKVISIQIILLLSVSGFLIVFVPAALASSGGKATFTSFELGPLNAPGTSCPNSAGSCWNENAEPQIRSDRAGNFYASSEFLPRTLTCSHDLDVVSPECGGTGAWKSTDGGLTYATLPSPNSISVGSTSSSPYGGDTDVATAPQRNSNGLYNVYVLSLERASGPLLSVEVSTSRDGGQTWLVNPTGATVPVDDRPWVAADGANKVCVSYHAVSAGFDVLVTCSNDGGITFDQVGNAFDSNHLWMELETQLGNLAIDPNSHVIYQGFSSLANQAESAECAVSCSLGFHTEWVSVSLDGGKTFADHVVYNNPNTSVNYGSQFASLAVDTAGNVYDLYTDGHTVFYSFSQDFGTTWSGPFQVSTTPANTAVEPWVAAGNAGQIDVVYYGTSFSNGTQTADNFPLSAAWYVYFAQNLRATTAGSGFDQVAATSIMHYGGVCLQGVTCTGNRDLFDDFGVAASPVTGLASIVYSTDQYYNTANDPVSPTCSASLTNTGSCDRTDIATQLSGSGIFQKPKGFQIHGQSLSLASGSPVLTFSLDNVGTYAVTSLNVQLAGVSTQVSWSSALPLLPGASISGQTTSFTGLLIAVGGVYTLSVTATLSDGEVVTQSVSVIGTLV